MEISWIFSIQTVEDEFRYHQLKYILHFNYLHLKYKGSDGRREKSSRLLSEKVINLTILFCKMSNLFKRVHLQNPKLQLHRLSEDILSYNTKFSLSSN